MKTWLPVVGAEGWYEVSRFGEVRSVDRVINFSDGRVRAYKGQTLAQYPDGFGYKKVTLKMNGAWSRVHVHVLVASAFRGPKPPNTQVRHFDGDHLNNTPKNLLWGTSVENHADIKRHGRQNRKRKLTDAQVRAIRAARGKKTCRELAAKYGTSAPHVCNIQLGNRRP